MDLEVREARATDGRAVAELVVAAFGDGEGPEIADLVAVPPKQAKGGRR